MTTFKELLERYPRIAITGVPLAGKTSLADTVSDRPVLHTDPDDLKAVFPDAIDWKDKQEVWDSAPFFIGQICADQDSFVVEGCSVARALRKGTVQVDAVVLFNEPVVEQTPEQASFGQGVLTIFEDVRADNPNLPLFMKEDLEIPGDSRVKRFATWTLDSSRIERTNQGGIRVPARMTKVGVFEYNRDGVTVREYRPPEEVFAPESIASLRGCTVVVDHPYEEGGEVTTANYRRLNVGHVEEPRQEGDAIVGWLVINDAETIRLIESRELREISCGYDNIKDPTPGTTPEGEQYDTVQRSITYNHVALGPPGWGRQGRDIGLTLDANDNQVPITVPEHATGEEPMPDDPNKPGAPGTQQPQPQQQQQQQPTNDETPPAAPAPVQLMPEEMTALKELAAAAPALMQLVKTGQAPAPAVPTSDTEEEQPTNDTSTEEEKKTMDAEEAERRIQDTVELREAARPILGKTYSFNGKSNRQIRADVVKSLDSSFKLDGISDAQLRGAYDMALKLHAERQKGASELAKIQRATRGQTHDSQPRKRLGQGAYEAHKKPSR